MASPLARRIAEQKGLDLSQISGTGPNGRIIKADVENAKPGAPPLRPCRQYACANPGPRAAAAPAGAQDFGIPHEVEKLSTMRKVIAKRLTESKQTVPHIYLTVDIRLDAMLKLRGELNAALEPQGVKLSVNDMLIKALAKSLEQVPACNVQFAGDTMLQFKPRRYFRRGVDPQWPDNPHREGRRGQGDEQDQHRDEGSWQPRERGQAGPRGIPGRHRQPFQHGHVRHQAVRSRHQSAPGYDHGHRRGREAAICRR